VSGRDVKRAIVRGGKSAARAAIRKGAPKAAAAAQAAVRKAAPKVAAKAARAVERTLLQQLGDKAASPFLALFRLLLARLSEVSSGAAISGGLANYAMIISGGGSHTIGLASLGLSAIPALVPDGTFSFRRSRSRKR
jgi:hypothetical protein